MEVAKGGKMNKRKRSDSVSKSAKVAASNGKSLKRNPPQKKGRKDDNAQRKGKEKLKSDSVDAILAMAMDDDGDFGGANSDTGSESEEGDYLEGIEQEEEEEEDNAKGVAKKGEKEGNKANGEEKKEDRRMRPYAPPTHEELMRIKDTEELFKSNLFRMQITELLNEVHVKYDKTVVIQSLTQKLHAVIESAPKKEFLGANAKPIPCAAGIPISPHEVKKMRFTFSPPEELQLVGSYLLRTQAKPILNMDVGIELPKGFIRQKDVLNHRYSFKRAAYLHFLAEHIKKDEHYSDITWTFFRGDVHKPVLTIRPKVLSTDEYQNVKTSFVINLLPILPESSIKLTKLMPDRANLHAHQATEKETAPVVGVTPQYNSRIAEDVYFRKHQEILHENLKLTPTMIDAAVLMRVWLHRRETISRDDGMNGFQATMLLVHLLQQHKVTKQMSSYQIFRVALDFLVKTDLPATGLVMNPESEETPQGPDHFAKFKAAYEVVLLDPTGRVNILSRMTKDAYAEIRREAALCLEYFNSPVVDGFDAVFIAPVNSWIKYDSYLHVELPVTPDTLNDKMKPEELAAYLDGGWHKFLQSGILAALETGLSDRIRFLRTIPTTTVATPGGKAVIVVGFGLNPENVGRLVDMGPPADHEEAAEFRKFWGVKSEIRRFRDGKINEAVVWTAGDNERHLVIKHIATYLMDRFYSIKESSVHYVADQLDSLLSVEGKVLVGNTNAEISAVWMELSSSIRGLIPKYVPLSVLAFHTISPAFRDTEVYPPQPHPLAGGTGERRAKLPLTVEPLNVLVQFENSSAWPDDLEAIRKLKSAFYIKIAQGLQKEHSLNCTATPEFVDIQCQGYVFRLGIHQLREATLLERTAPGQLLNKQKKFDTSKFAVSVTDRSVHAGNIHGFGQRHPSYGTTVRLAKKWLESHLFSDYIRSEAVELIVASLYTDSRPYLPPHSHLIGFLRFLTLISTFDWQNQPLVVDVDNELTSNDRERILKAFERMRTREKHHREEQEAKHQKVDEGFSISLFIATPADRFSKWTRGGVPSPLIWQRIAAYAGRSFQAVLSLLMHPTADSLPKWKVIFRTPIKQHYDVLIHLKPTNKALKKFGVVDPLRYKNLQVENDRGLLIGLSLVERYVRELKEHFGDMALFFYDRSVGNLVAVVWKPSAFEEKSFNVLNAFCAMPAALAAADQKKGGANKKQQANRVVLNGLDVLEQFQALGAGLVDKIEIENPTYPGKKQ